MTDTTEHKEIAELKEKIESEFTRGYDAGVSECSVDAEFLEEKDEEIEKLTAELKKLKDEQAKTILGAKVNIWRECQMQFNSQFGTRETLAFITQECISGDKQLIKEIFDIHEYPFYWDIENNDINNGDEESEEESDEESD